MYFIFRHCIVDGREVTEQKITINENEFSDATKWTKCPVPHLLNIPLVVKRVGPSPNIQDNELAVFLMVDPATGFAPPKWQSKLGRLMFARTDKQPFTSSMFWSVYSYIFDLMDLYADGEIQNIRKNKLNPKAFERYREQDLRIQGQYKAQTAQLNN